MREKKSDSFSADTIRTLMERAGNRCSNPDCFAITSGPAKNNLKSVKVGEAAHIFGARQGSARFCIEMTSIQRSNIENGIWLCCICHKKIDSDASRYPADLLLDWNKRHQKQLTEELGRPKDTLSTKPIERNLEPFLEYSCHVQRIANEKPFLWEYLLTAELLRTKLEPINSRWSDLNKGFVTKSLVRIEEKDSLDWIGDRVHELENFTKTACNVINTKFNLAWGLPGEPGCPKAILNCCDIIKNICEELILWEEKLKFSTLSEDYSKLKNLFVGIGGRLLCIMINTPLKLFEVFNEGVKPGEYEIKIIIDLPRGWVKKVKKFIKRIESKKLNAF